MSMKKSIKKGLIITLLTVCLLIVVVAVTVLSVVIFEPVIYGDFYKDAKQEFDLPGKSDGFIQQGITHSGDYFLSSGYMSGGLPSRIYITDKDGKSTWVSLKDHENKDFKGHAGGIAAYGDTVYVCGDESGQMLVYSLSGILDTKHESSVSANSDFTVHCNTSFCYVSGDVLYVGEFFRKQNYSTDEKHHIKTPAGDQNHSMIFAYNIDPDTSAVSDVPFKAYSAPDLAQGMCITVSGKVVISTSYGFASSHLYVYNLPETANDHFSIGDVEIPLYYLDSASLDNDITAPPMSECLVYVGGRVYVIGESASNKYIFGKILRARYVWSIPLS